MSISMRPRLENGTSTNTHFEEGWIGHRCAESSYGSLENAGTHKERWERVHTDTNANGWCGKSTLGNTYGKPLTGRRFAGAASYGPGAPT